MNIPLKKKKKKTCIFHQEYNSYTAKEAMLSIVMYTSPGFQFVRVGPAVQ